MTENEARYFSWDNEEWLIFSGAVGEIVAKVGLSRGVAERTLRVLCGSGDIRSICCDEDFEEEPTIIKPEKWRETGELDLHGMVVSRVVWNEHSRNAAKSWPSGEGKLDSERRWHDTVLVSDADLQHWLKKQTKPEPRQRPASKLDMARQAIDAMWPVASPQPSSMPK